MIYYALPGHYTIGTEFTTLEAAAKEAALRLIRFRRENERDGRFNPDTVSIDERVKDETGDRPVRRFYLTLTGGEAS